MKKSFIYIISSVILLCTACEIERLPYGSMASDVIQDNPEAYLEPLMMGMYAQLKTWSDPMHRCGEYAGDNMMIRGSSTDAFFEFISFARTPNNYRLQNFWDYSYKAIAQASNIIKMIDEGRSPEVDDQIGQCYYVRGMLYFYLARAYGRPYYQAPDRNLGVPIVNGTPDDMLGDMHLPDRATVSQTYQQAIDDLKKAAALLTNDHGKSFASAEAAEAMLSRVYLYMSGTYEAPNTQWAEAAVASATKVINSGKYKLLPREQFMVYPTLDPDNNSESIFVIRRVASEFAGYDHYYGVGGMYANIGGMGWGEMFASADYIALLNENGRNDWREHRRKIIDARASFIEPTYQGSGEAADTIFRFIYKNENGLANYAQLTTKPNEDGTYSTAADATTNYPLTLIDKDEQRYSINYRGQTCEGVIDAFITENRGYPQFYITKCSREGEDSHLHSPVISRLAEVYLNRAEALAKLGRYSEALADLNIIRGRAIEGGEYASLDASNAAELIDKERRLELAYQAERSYDVFRNGKPLVRRYPGPHNQLADIAATDYRVVYYIPQNAINSYPGTLTQNPTSDADVIVK